ncbi:lactoylglutathione lyase [Plasticicumulans acidivorans]|uniref:lactoylglutathione lyase n=1 Tax=Plasticicumulans acidivorans TaxID=886464 RepID=A0A317MUY3_9GAMM|nr:lactoylglutathione lyase [Plasticicumulans acidivorans]PWV60650.1 lactoylglutathione lyase [Plasticicumulans acidivorans]
MRYLHTMIRVGDLDRSINFYTDVLGFSLVSRNDYPEGEFTLAFLRAPGDADGGPMLELTYNWGVASYDLGKGYGHIALQVESMDAFAGQLAAHGQRFSWGPGKAPNGRTVIAFIVDPDGYQIELIEQH